MSKEVYLPVAVTLAEDGSIESAYVDFDGAPWMYVQSEANVWDSSFEEWSRDDELETAAEQALYKALA